MKTCTFNCLGVRFLRRLSWRSSRTDSGYESLRNLSKKIHFSSCSFLPRRRRTFLCFSFLSFASSTHIYFMIRSKPFRFCEWIHKCSITLTTSTFLTSHTNIIYDIVFWMFYNTRSRATRSSSILFTSINWWIYDPHVVRAM